MPCEVTKEAIVNQKRCRWCGKLSTKLCDFILVTGRTCDQPICQDHAQSRGFQIDFCPNHSTEPAQR
jgi:hypothetical protein